MALDFDRVSETGTWWRQVRSEAHPLALSEPPGDGRWRKPEAGGALYLADHEDTAWAEWYRALSESGFPPRAFLPTDMWPIQAVLADLADLSDDERLARVGLKPPVPDRRTWPAYQEVGEAIHAESCRGLIAPSSARPAGLVLCVFEPEAVPEALTPGERRTVGEAPPPPRGMRT